MCCVLIVKIVEAVVIHYTVYFDKFICRPYDVLKLRHMNWPAPESNKQGGAKRVLGGTRRASNLRRRRRGIRGTRG